MQIISHKAYRVSAGYFNPWREPAPSTISREQAHADFPYPLSAPTTISAGILIEKKVGEGNDLGEDFSLWIFF